MALDGKMTGRLDLEDVELKRYIEPVREAKNDCIVLSTTENVKYSVAGLVRIASGEDEYGVVVIRSCSSPQRRLPRPSASALGTGDVSPFIQRSVDTSDADD